MLRVRPLDVWWALAADLSAARWSRGAELVMGLLSMCKGREDDEDKEGVWFSLDMGGATAELFATVDMLWRDF